MTSDGRPVIAPRDDIARLWKRRYDASARSEIRRLIALLKLARDGGFFGFDESGDLA